MKVLKVTSFVDELDPKGTMKGPVPSGATIESIVPPSCWGPMITPHLKSGHEVTQPVAIEDAKPGDAVAITIQSIEVQSSFTSSGTGQRIEGRFEHDPSSFAICPVCNTSHPKTYLSGIGEEAIKCETCHSSILPQTIDNGYTLVFDEDQSIGISVPESVAKQIAEQLEERSSLPKNSTQHPVNILAKGDIPGMITRVEPMIGNIGSLPRKLMPSSRNTGDYITRLTGVEKYKNVLKEDLTDGHMDVNTVREGTILIVPVKVEGAGIYFGDVHSIQGNGELAGHTADITAKVTLKLDLIKDLTIKGPIIIPRKEALPPAFRPITEEEFKISQSLAKQYHFSIDERLYPVQWIGTGEDLHVAIDNAVERAHFVTGLDPREIKNRATVNGSVDLGRTSGVIYMTTMLPKSIYKRCLLLPYIHQQYN